MVKRGIKNEIIDFEKKGNLIRFYLGKNGKQWGDDWDDAPYEHNAGKVYDEFIKGYCDIVIDFDYKAEEPHEYLNVTNSEYCRQDMIKKKIFALVIGVDEYQSKCLKHIYFGDKIEDILKLEHCHLVKLVYKEGER